MMPGTTRMSSEPMTASDQPRQFYHGTRADLKPGDLIEAGYSSNYGARKQAAWVYLTGTLDDGPSRTAEGTRHRGNRLIAESCDCQA
ncbi:NAD(+)--rifampin ADP-ribosyltransferase [Mesorhizobium sp. M1169]|uniref:NAD(+)--rifampin ADP-ribosyltransferase n=2 Tax=unclassified Mesorhizobium TaxID=325217 RepID=UPI0033369428